MASWLSGISHNESRRGTLHRVRCEVFTVVTMKNVVFWDIKNQFVPHRKHISATESRPLMLW
jgi:hypothetical protein